MYVYAVDSWYTQVNVVDFEDVTFGRQETLHPPEKLVHSQTDLARLAMAEPERSYAVRRGCHLFLHMPITTCLSLLGYDSEYSQQQ